MLIKYVHVLEYLNMLSIFKYSNTYWCVTRREISMQISKYNVYYFSVCVLFMCKSFFLNLHKTIVKHLHPHIFLHTLSERRCSYSLANYLNEICGNLQIMKALGNSFNV